MHPRRGVYAEMQQASTSLESGLGRVRCTCHQVLAPVRVRLLGAVYGGGPLLG